MESTLKKKRMSQAAVTASKTALLCLLLIGCGESATPAASAAMGPGSNIAVPTLTTVPTPALPKAAVVATRFAEDQAAVAALETRTALGTPFVFTPIPLATAIPMTTPQTGIRGCTAGSGALSPTGCWAGAGDGGFVFATTGTLLGDDTQGVIQVLTTTLDQRTFGPKQTYPIPQHVTEVHPAQVDWPRMTLIALSDNAPTRMFVFNLHTRIWEPPDSCPIYPIALHRSTLQGVRPRYDARSIQQGTGIGAFGWLRWRSEDSDVALAQSLTVPGDSQAYMNPDNPADHVLAAGKWVRGRAAVANGSPVANALAALHTTHYRVVVPVWDQAIGTGSTLRYHITSFAWVSLDSVDTADPNQLTIRYWGRAACPPGP